MSETWIEEQKKNKLFRGGGRGGDAIRMLEHSLTNRILSASQGKKFTCARIIGDMLGVKCFDQYATYLEKAQMCVDGKTRSDFMRVAIEQWQGKINAHKKFTSLDNLV